jgi:hypothetical protein
MPPIAATYLPSSGTLWLEGGTIQESLPVGNPFRIGPTDMLSTFAVLQRSRRGWGANRTASRKNAIANIRYDMFQNRFYGSRYLRINDTNASSRWHESGAQALRFAHSSLPSALISSGCGASPRGTLFERFIGLRFGRYLEGVSRDGHYVQVGDSGDVIDTTTHQVVNQIPGVLNARRASIEIDLQNGVPVSTTSRYGLGYVRQ